MIFSVTKIVQKIAIKSLKFFEKSEKFLSLIELNSN